MLVFGKRWPDRIKEVARSSSLGRQVVRRALERAEDIVVRIKADAPVLPSDEPVPANPLF
jgi:hypothetical protein